MKKIFSAIKCESVVEALGHYLGTTDVKVVTEPTWNHWTPFFVIFECSEQSFVTSYAVSYLLTFASCSFSFPLHHDLHDHCLHPAESRHFHNGPGG